MHERKLSNIHIDVLDISKLIENVNASLNTPECPIYPHNADIKELIPDAPWGLLTSFATPFEKDIDRNEYIRDNSDAGGQVYYSGELVEDSGNREKDGKSKNAVSVFALNHEGLFTHAPLNNKDNFLKISFYPVFNDGSMGFEPAMYFQLNLTQVMALPIACKTDLSVFLKRSTPRSHSMYNFLCTFYAGLASLVPEGKTEVNKCNTGINRKREEEKESLKKYGNYLINHECNCSTFNLLVSVTQSNICPCGAKDIHMHCKNCGGFRTARDFAEQNPF